MGLNCCGRSDAEITCSSGLSALGYAHERRSQRAACALVDPGELLPAMHRVASSSQCLEGRWSQGLTYTPRPTEPVDLRVRDQRRYGPAYLRRIDLRGPESWAVDLPVTLRHVRI